MIDANNVHKITVKTEEEMLAQAKLLLNNGYTVGIDKNDNLLGCVSYTLIYTKRIKGDE